MVLLRKNWHCVARASLRHEVGDTVLLEDFVSVHDGATDHSTAVSREVELWALGLEIESEAASEVCFLWDELFRC